MSAERGPYLTPNRALNIERAIARLDGKWTERFDQLTRELERERQRNDVLRRLVLELAEQGGSARGNHPRET